MIRKWIKQKFEKFIEKEVEADIKRVEEEVIGMINYIVVCPEMLEFLSKKKGAISLHEGIVYKGVLFKGRSLVDPNKMIVKGHKDQIIHIANVGTDWRNYDK